MLQSLPLLVYSLVTFWLQRAGSLPCACVFAALYACAIAYWLHASLRANNATYAHKAVTGRVEPKSYSLVEGNQTIIGAKRVHIIKQVTLVYLYHVNRCGHHKKLSIAKLDFVQVCGLSLNFYNNTLRKFYKFSDSRET